MMTGKPTSQPIQQVTTDPPSGVLLPFDLSGFDMSKIEDLDAESLKAAIRAVKRLPLEATSANHSSHSNTSPGTPSWSSHNSFYESEDETPGKLTG